MGVLFLDIVTTAAILFAVATGLMIILGVMKLINFAHGAFLTIGGYSAFVVTQLGWNPWLAIPFAALVGFVLGLIVEHVIVRRKLQFATDSFELVGRCRFQADIGSIEVRAGIHHSHIEE